MKTIHLRTEYLQNPLGLDISCPKFYWQCEGGIKQTAYQIIAKVGEETVWNSGKVESSAMTHIPYGGRPLKSRERVHWSVKLWDENGAVCQWLFDTVSGIRPDGENRFVIQPVPGGSLSFAKTSHKSLYGTVESNWERKEDATTFTVTVPANTTARLMLPNGDSWVLQAGSHMRNLSNREIR